MFRIATVSAALSWIAWSSPTHAQGITPYVNFESPALHPIALAEIDDEIFLLVCNIPDSSVEIYDTDTNAYVGRIAVGQEPVTVVVRPGSPLDESRRCYTANWLGDSISAFDLFPDGTTKLVRTGALGDEPMGIAFHPDDASLIVTFSTNGRWGRFDSDTFQPVASGERLIELVAKDGERAIKDPRAVRFSPTEELFILNHRGGTTSSPTYDFDVWGRSVLSTTSSNQQADLEDTQGLGSTNFDMVFAPNGDLFLATQEALNRNVPLFITGGTGEAVARDLVTDESGFVESQLVRVRNVGTLSSVTKILDLNQELSASIHPDPIAQPTSVIVYGSGEDEETRVFVTGFGSDSLGMVEITTGDVWSLTRIDVSTTTPFTSASTSGTLRGPRAMALKASGTPNDPDDRLYVYNRLENSVTVIDPNLSTLTPQAGVLAHFPLQVDPTPSYVRDGQKFLYSARMSAHGQVSCASCHIDANSDFLAWNLSDGVTLPSPTGTPGGDPDLPLGGPNGTGPNKGALQTQSLRGLVTYEVAAKPVQDRMFTNAPYHWRGDRADFAAFDEAFSNLMASNDDAPVAQDMESFRAFVDSVHYPPNPNQSPTRVYSGSMRSDPPASGDYDDEDAGSGALLGLKQFMIKPTEIGGGIACQVCHTLPEGSNNRLTDRFNDVSDDPLDPDQSDDEVFLETAQLRGLVTKETEVWRLVVSTGVVTGKPSSTTPWTTAEFGLTHRGKQVNGSPVATSVASFVERFTTDIDQNAMNRYMREFDHGVAPIVGSTRMYDAPSFNSTHTGLSADFDLREAQARLANAGLVVHVNDADVLRGFWFDVTNAAAPYREVPHGALTPIGPLTRAQILAGLDVSDPENYVVASSVPLGSERRLAFLDGGLPPTYSTTAPGGVVLRGCVLPTHHTEIPNLTEGWHVPATSGLFDNPNHRRNVGNNLTVLLYQESIIEHGSSTWGLTSFRHEAPRRFMVEGEGIRHGAWVRIYLPTATDWASAAANVLGTGPTTTPNSTSNPGALHFPIFAAVDPMNSEAVVWQTAVELEPLFLLGLLVGGPSSSEVALALDDPQGVITTFALLPPPAIPPTGTTDYFLPRDRNWYYVEVENDVNNPGSTTSPGSWHRLTLE